MFIWCYLLILQVKQAQFASSCYLETTEINIGSPITSFEIWFQFNFDFQKYDSQPFSTNMVRMYSESTENLFSLDLKYEISKVMQLIEYKLSDQANIQVGEKYLAKWSQLIYRGDQMIVIDFKFDDIHKQQIQNQSIIDNFRLLLTPKIKGKLLKHKICFVQGVPSLQNRLTIKNDLILVNELKFSQKFSNQYLTIRGWFRLFSFYDNKLHIMDNMSTILTIQIQIGQIKIFYQLDGDQKVQYDLGFQLNWFYFVFQQIYQSNGKTANRVSLFEPFGLKNDQFITKDKFSFDLNIKINFQSLFHKDLQIFDQVKTEPINFMCPPDCEQCGLNMVCQKCKQGRYLINGICYCNDPVQQNLDDCKCKTKLYLDMSQLVEIKQYTFDCPQGYQICGAQIFCSYGYHQVGNECRECPSFEGEICQDCIDNPGFWDSNLCYSQKRFVDSFIQKRFPHDSDYMIDYNQTSKVQKIQFKQKNQILDQRVDICKFGYFYRSKKCLNCPYGCKKCSFNLHRRQLECDVCESSFEFAEKSLKCQSSSNKYYLTQLCISQNCKVCLLSNIRECYQCKTGYFLNVQTNQCQICMPSKIFNKMSNNTYYYNDIRYMVIKNLTNSMKLLQQNLNSLQRIEEMITCNFNYVQENNQIDILMDKDRIGCKIYTNYQGQWICQQAFEPAYKLNNYLKKAVYCPNNTFCINKYTFKAKFVMKGSQLMIADDVQAYTNLKELVQNINPYIFEFLTVSVIEIELSFQETSYTINYSDLRILELDIYLENMYLYLTILGQNALVTLQNYKPTFISLLAYERIHFQQLRIINIFQPLIFVICPRVFMYLNMTTSGQLGFNIVDRIQNIKIANSTYNGENTHTHPFISIFIERQYQIYLQILGLVIRDLHLQNTNFIIINEQSGYSAIEVDSLSVTRMDLQNSVLICIMGEHNSLAFDNVKMNYISTNNSKMLNLYQTYVSLNALSINSIFANQSQIIRFSQGCFSNISIEAGSLIKSSFFEIQIQLFDGRIPNLYDFRLQQIRISTFKLSQNSAIITQAREDSSRLLRTSIKQAKVERLIFFNNNQDCLFQLVSQILEIDNIQIENTFGLTCQFRIDSLSIKMSNFQSFNNQIISNYTQERVNKNDYKLISLDYIINLAGFSHVLLENFDIKQNQIESRSYVFLSQKLKSKNITIVNFNVKEFIISEELTHFIFLPITVTYSSLIIISGFKADQIITQKNIENVLISISSFSTIYVKHFDVKNVSNSNLRYFEINGSHLLIEDIIVNQPKPQECRLFYILCQNLILRDIKLYNIQSQLDSLIHLESNTQLKSNFKIYNISQNCHHCQQQGSLLQVFLNQRKATNKVYIERILQIGIIFMLKSDQSLIKFKVPSQNTIRITNIIVVGSILVNGNLFLIDSNFNSQLTLINMLIFFANQKQKQSGTIFNISKTPFEIDFVRISQNSHNFLIASQVQNISISNVLVTQIFLQGYNFMAFVSQINNEIIKIKILNVAIHGQSEKILTNSLIYINQEPSFPVEIQLSKLVISNITQTQHIFYFNNTNKLSKLIIKNSVLYRSRCMQMCFEIGNEQQLALIVLRHIINLNNVCNGMLNLFSEKLRVSEIVLNNRVDNGIQVIFISNNYKIKNQEIIQQKGVGIYQKSIQQHQIDLEKDSEYGIFLEFASQLVLSFDYGTSHLPNSKQRQFFDDKLIDQVQASSEIDEFYLPSGQSLKNYKRLNINRLTYEYYLNPLRVFALSNDKQIIDSRLQIQCYLKNDQNFTFGPFTLGWEGKQLDDLILYQNPYQNQSTTYNIKCDLLKIEYLNNQHNLTIPQDYQLQFKIRTFKCQLGEIYINNGCQLCDSGSFQYSVDRIGQVCKHISNEKVKALQPGLLQLNSGYWRPNYYNDKIEKCYDSWNYCDGGYQVGDQTCQPGYIGPLCLQCDIYNKRGFGNFGTKNQQCSVCNEGYQNYIYILLSVIWQVFSVSFTCRSLHFMAQQHKKLMSSSPLYQVLNKTQIGNYLYQSDQITIVLKQFQNFVLLILFINSREFQLWKYINYVIYFFTNPLNVQSNQMECLIKQFGIYDNFTQIKLALQLQFPLLILTIFYVMYGFAVKVFKIKFQWLFITQSLIIVYIFNQIGLFSQTVSMVSYSTFSGIKWMNADLSIQFYDDEYRTTLYLSASVICIFLLIPIIMLFVLYRNRKKLLRSRQFGNFCYLYREYKLKYYYWEILQMAFTLSFISATKVLQDYLFPKQLLQVLIILTYVYLLMQHHPYKLIILNRSEIKFKLILMISILLVMMIQSTKNDSLNLSIYLILYLVNIICVARVIRFIVMKCLSQYSQAVDQVKEKITQTFPRLSTSKLLRPKKQFKELTRLRFHTMYQSKDKIRESMRQSSTSSNRNIRLSGVLQQSDVLSYRLQPANESSQSIQVPFNEILNSSIVRNNSILKNNLKQKEIELSALRQKK